MPGMMALPQGVTPRRVLAGLFAVGAVVFAIIMIGLPTGSRSGSGSSAASPDEAGVARLEALDAFAAADTPSDAARIADEIVERVGASLDEARDEGAYVPYESQLRELIRERVRLTLDPDYDAYVRHVGELLGRDGASALEGTMFEDEKLWRGFAQPSREVQIAIDPARAMIERGDQFVGEGMAGGQRTLITDPGIYGAVALAESGAPRVDVEIPMMLIPTHDGADASGMVVFVTMRFVLDASRGVWLPYQTVTSDPTGTYEQMGAMWI